MQRLTEVKGFKFEIVLHPRFHSTKGLIYMHGCDMEDTEQFKAFLQERYKVKDVQPATFIRLRNPQT